MSSGLYAFYVSSFGRVNVDSLYPKSDYCVLFDNFVNPDELQLHSNELVGKIPEALTALDLLRE